MGEVYSARDTELGRAVALKFLPHQSSDTKAVERLISEARAASGLNHPNIVTVYEVIRSDSSLAIAMELVEGVPLRALCKAGVPVEQIAKWISQVAQALATAHQHRLIHRDVKPENIVVRPDGYVKVLDFGLARNLDLDASATTRELPPGTLRYMAPEQVLREALTPACDVFALGLVFFELLTGRHAFEADSPFSTAYAIAHEKAPLPSTFNPAVPPAIDALVGAMLARAPAERPSMEHVVAALAPGEAPRTGQRGRPWLLFPFAAAVAAVAAALAFYNFRERTFSPGDLKGRPLTSRPGAETMPVISPDGSRVAFAWAERQDQVPEIYVQGVSADEPRKLTTSSARVRALAWSADGADVLVIRNKASEDRAEIVAMPAAGGLERILGETLSNCAEPELDVSPDGRWIAIPDCGPGMEFPAIYLFSPRTSERKRLTSPSGSTRGDMTPRFSPDGRTLAFKRAAKAAVEDVYLVPAEGGTPQQISHDGRNLGGLAWLPGGRALVISSAREGSLLGLWYLPISGTAKPQRLTQVGYHAIAPSIARTSGRLVWVNQLTDSNVWRVPLTGGTPERVIASTLRDQDADYGPDGRLVFRSARSGSSEVWIAKGDGSNPIRLTEAKGPVTGSPRWSPDGRFIAYDSRPAGNPDIYLLACPGAHGPCGRPQRLTTSPASDVLPSWSSDGTQIYFSSDATGGRELWRIPAGGGEATQLTKRGGYTSRETADGIWLYFAKPTSGIWRMPGPKSAKGLSPDAEEFVVEVSGDNELASWDVVDGEVVYFRQVAGGSRVEAYQVERKVTRTLATSRERIVGGVAVSPDRKWVAFGRLDRAESNVMVADVLQ